MDLQELKSDKLAKPLNKAQKHALRDSDEW